LLPPTTVKFQHLVFAITIRPSRIRISLYVPKLQFSCWAGFSIQMQSSHSDEQQSNTSSSSSFTTGMPPMEPMPPMQMGNMQMKMGDMELNMGATASGQKFCTQCGTPVKSADKFCASCGHKLES
jgi:zinc-ribbon domain